MTLVTVLPSWGTPEESSNTDPTDAIPATQEQAKNSPLLGVNIPLTNQYRLNFTAVSYP